MMKRKKLEGFTLVEIIVALAVFAVMSLIVVMIFQMANSIIRDSQSTSQKANVHASLASKIATTKDASYDTISTGQKIILNGETLSKVDVITIEGESVYSDSPEGSFYENAPSVRVFTSGS